MYVRKLKIALVAPLYVPVPPKGYGGIERDVHYLGQELTKAGHDVTIFCSGDSETDCTVFASIPQALGLNPPYFVPVRESARQMLDLIKMQDQFDIINFHCNHIQYLIEKSLHVPFVTTLHIHQLSEFEEIYCQNHPFIAISEHQRQSASKLNWIGTAHNGKPFDLYSPVYEKGDYLAFLGSFVPDKGPHTAISIAKKTGNKLKIGAKIYPAYNAYYQTQIKPAFGSNGIEYLGELDNAQKQALLGHAKALLFPITWDEPFGLVMIEAMACGTPVIGFRRGAVAEIVEDGVSGFVVDNEDEAIAALAKISQLDRRKVREAFERRFTAKHMADSHMEAYRKVIGRI